MTKTKEQDINNFLGPCFFSKHDLMEKQIIPTMTMFLAGNPPESLATPQDNTTSSVSVLHLSEGPFRIKLALYRCLFSASLETIGPHHNKH